ncbi:YheU family protein [Thalassotalea piscium]
MIVPYQSLDSETLNAVIEAFILREGTDYGLEEYSLSDKIEHVISQLASGAVVLVYSELHETVNILPKDQFQ